MGDKKFFDVSKPGKAMPQTGAARPAIVGHRTLLKDPMMVAPEKTVVAAPDMAPPSETTASEPADQKVVRTGGTKIEPVHEESAPPDVTASQPLPVEEPQNEDSSSDAPKTNDGAEAPSSQTNMPKESDTKDQSEQPGSEGEEANNADAVTQQADKVAQLITDKTYFVPIGEKHQTTHAKKSSAATVYLLVGLLLLVAALYLAIDGGLINVPFELPIKILSK